MDGNAIKQLIDGLSPGGVLTLVPGGIPNAPRIDALVTGCFGGTLTATIGVATVGATSVTYAAAQLASKTFLFYLVDANVPATLTFTTGSGGTLDLAVTATMPAGWTLAASFPAVGDLTDSALNALTFTAASIAVASADSASASLIDATIDTTKSATANFEFLLGPSCAVSGGAEMVTGGNGFAAPSFHLTSQKIQGPSINGFSLDLFLELGCLPSPVPLPDGTTPLAGTVAITTDLLTPALTVPIQIEVTAADQTSYMVKLDTSGGVPPINSLDQLTGFTYGTSPATLLTAANTPIGTLTLDYLFATINTKTWSISNLQFEISLGTNWTVIGGVFQLQRLIAAVTIPVLWNGSTSPPDGNGFSLLVAADFIVATAPLEVGITYPSLVMTVGLQQGKVIDINDFLGQFAQGLKLPGTASDMAVSVFSATADIQQSTYSLNVGANGSLSVIPGFTLTEIDMAISYASSAVQSFQFGSHFTIANAPLALTAAYDPSPNWAFEGGSEPGQSINLSDLISQIGTIFGVSLPTPIQIVLSKLDMTYGSAAGNFSFEAEIDYVNESDPILKKISGGVAITYSGTPAKTWTGNVHGEILVGSNQFTVNLDFQKDTVLSMQWKAVDDEVVTIADLCGIVGITPPDIPPGLDLDLTEVDGAYDITQQILLLGAISKTWGAADVAIWYDATNRWQFYFGMATSTSILLSKLPLVGSAISKFGDVALDSIQGMASVPVLTETQAGKIIDGFSKFPAAYPRPPATGLPNGVALTMEFDVNGSKTSITIGTPTASLSEAPGTSLAEAPAPAAPPTPPAQQRPTGDTPATASDGTKWFAVQQSIGPVSIQKVGVHYDTTDAKLWALINATVTIGPLEIGLMGLGAGSPLTSFQPSFTVAGISASLQAGELAISGALVGKIDPVDLYGELSLEMGPISLGALAGYATYEGDPSFFLYAVLDAPLGGPSFFFVTGVSAGFGINRQLLIPDVSGVADFPLVQWAVGINAPNSSPSGDIGSQVAATMQTLSQSGVIAPEIGEYWFAAGLRFTSFELLDTFALLTVSLGKDFEVDILGLSSLSLPPAPATPLAFAQLAIKASIKPSQGVLSIAGQLTSASYLLSKDCHLTGGFAFYLWYSGDYAGQFVVTLGGYSSHYNVPKYYPVVPRLGLNWQVTPQLTISGGEYFALTSSAVMAGGSLSAVWSSGGLRAWFDVEADFLLVFQPLHYYISASIDLGASFSIDLWFTTITITIHVGVGAEIWGPDFSGEVDVDLDIISFTIGFGHAPRSGDTTVDWGTFTSQMLPKAPGSSAKLARRSAMLALADAAADDTDPPPPPVLQINATTGLLNTFDPSTGLDWLVDGHSFQCTVVSNIPLSAYQFLKSITTNPNDSIVDITLSPAQVNPTTTFGVGPVGVAQLTSNLTLQFTTEENSQFLAEMQLQNISKAMWEKRDFDSNGVPKGVDPLNDTTIPNVLTGFTLVPTVPPPDHTLPIKLEYLKYTIDPAVQTLTWSKPVVQTSDPFTSAETVQNTIGSARATANRAALITAINNSGFAVNTAVNVSSLADRATSYLLAAPELRYLGEAA
ncbi:conserved protein of unknown function [Bradyrhizobium sp. ORS 285]|uniref:DUF6603 domain-containing protein n=1 Tax=Bradyrhizobium sp. ORS 285 TaxID=115808 RepID=UPI000240AB3C|nr:DUF6603 domain-containing protein [Bradyrhizobium sp. ORS 285]CCD84731.1 conserved hypothetical protein [Bradyrhizobium sp. ORS 285]SMX61170.1 conserved protein of unknown function [Bradyrhizobium sp. ORS 285]